MRSVTLRVGVGLVGDSQHTICKQMDGLSCGRQVTTVWCRLLGEECDLGQGSA
jgi:hypothetical protein